MIDRSANEHEQLILLSRLIEQSTALADALGLDETAADLRRVRVDAGAATAGEPDRPPRRP